MLPIQPQGGTRRSQDAPSQIGRVFKGDPGLRGAASEPEHAVRHCESVPDAPHRLIRAGPGWRRAFSRRAAAAVADVRQPHSLATSTRTPSARRILPLEWLAPAPSLLRKTGVPRQALPAAVRDGGCVHVRGGDGGDHEPPTGRGGGVEERLLAGGGGQAAAELRRGGAPQQRAELLPVNEHPWVRARPPLLDLRPQTMLTHAHGMSRDGDGEPYNSNCDAPASIAWC
jgi:hypothetical protein